MRSPLLFSFGQTRNSASKPAWKFSVSPSTVDPCTSVSLVVTKPRLKLSGAIVETNLINELTGSADGIWVFFRSSKRCSKFCLLCMISEIELLWTRLSANSTACSSCLAKDCTRLVREFNLSMIDTRVFSRVVMASRSHCRILATICSAAWLTSNLALLILLSSFKAVSSYSRITSLQTSLFSFNNTAAATMLTFVSSAAFSSGSTSWLLWSVFMQIWQTQALHSRQKNFINFLSW